MTNTISMQGKCVVLKLSSVNKHVWNLKNGNHKTTYWKSMTKHTQGYDTNVPDASMCRSLLAKVTVNI